MTTSDIDEVGEIQKQTCFQWDIEEYFSSITQKADISVTSPRFHFSNTSWYLQLYPNGQRWDNSVGYISIYLCAENPTQKGKKVNYTISIRCANGVFIEYSAQHFFTDLKDRWGIPKVVDRTALLRQKNLYVLGDTLTVVCKARCKSSPVKEVASQTNYSYSISTLSEDLRNLFINEKNSDVTIKVQDRIFKVHKIILESRSPVLSAMFAHYMKENKTGIVNIDDCKPEIFYEFLLYLYSEKVENLSSNNVVDLYLLADEYDLADLRSLCLNFMKDNLDQNNVCDVMVLADRLGKEELKKSASQMIKSNLKTLIPSSQWITFMAENPVLAAQLFMEVLPDGSHRS